jgi:sortase (surface protein transpeptidase)
MRGTLVVGLLLLVVPPVAWWATTPPDTVGIDPTASEPLDPTEPLDRWSASWSWVGDADAPALEGREVPQAADIDAPGGAVPVHLVIPAVGVDHPIVEVGLHPDGAMEIPYDVHEIGWFVPLGIHPGDPGAAVFAGHVDSRTQGRGAFFDLQALDVGDRIAVVTEEGEQRWTVMGRARYPKTELPVARVFATSGETRLVLITCGGDFDAGRRSYADNVVVYAELAPAVTRSAPPASPAG